MASEITLFTPGPTHIPDSVFEAMSRPNEHHRTKEFRALFQETGDTLQSVFKSPSPPLFLACSGSGAMEAILRNTLGKDDHLGYLNAGKFGSRWGAIADAIGVKNTELNKEWGDSPTVDEVRAFLKENSSLTHFALQYCETSTSVLHKVPEITAMIRDEFPKIYTIVDAISAATTLPIHLESLAIDGLVLASQKAFMLPPGLSIVFLSERYWDKAENTPSYSLYFDLKKERDSQKKGNAAWTPAMNTIFGLSEVLRIFESEGWENVYRRHSECSDFCHRKFSELNITPVNSSHRSPSVSGGFPADRIDGDEVRAKLFEKTQYRIAGGQDHWKGKVLRFGHMGIIREEDLERCFNSLSEIMS